MPWKVYSLWGARRRFVQACLKGSQPIAQLCRQLGISSKTGFKWLARFRAEGGPGLQDRSRRPAHSPTRTARRWRQAIGQLRRKHPSWGSKKIYARLRRQHPHARLPQPRTITDWLQRLGLVAHRPARARRGPRVPAPYLTIPQVPNDLWTVDFKGWFRTCDGQRVDPLTVRDLFSRYILDIRLLQPRHDAVQQHFRRLFASYGQPKAIRVDHGAPFAGDGALDLSRLSAWWLRLGIRVEFTRRARPQDNGAHEQMHRVYKAEMASPPAKNARAQQQRTTRWVRYYNYQRPHEALRFEVPGAFYRPSRHRYRPRLPEIKYPDSWPTRRVAPAGYIRWRGRARVIGRAFSRQRVGFKLLRPGVYEVYFAHQLIGHLVETDPGGLRPAHWSRAQTTMAQP
jgi:putative transposase